jgi:hypothetical protein
MIPKVVDDYLRNCALSADAVDAQPDLAVWHVFGATLPLCVLGVVFDRQ